MGGHRVFDPAVEARHAEVDRFLAKDLTLQLLLAHAFHPADQALDLGSDVFVEIGLRDDRWLWVGNSVDSDKVVIASTRMDVLRSAFAVQLIHLVAWLSCGTGSATAR
jgi:hypothetical protein